MLSTYSIDLLPKYENDDNTPDRSETERIRPPQPGIVYEPQHDILQNRLRKALRIQYGMRSVSQEKDFIDLKLIESGKIAFIEIKMEKKVKNCIRFALGQLIEYSHYPNL